MEISDSQRDLLALLFQLIKQSKDIIFNTQVSVEEKSIEMLSLFKSDSLDFQNKVVQYKIHDVKFSKTKIKYMKLAINVTRNLVRNYQQFLLSPVDFFVHLDTIFWVVGNFLDSHTHEKLRSMIADSFNKEILLELDKFAESQPHDCPSEVSENGSDSIDYLEKISEEMLAPWREKVEVNFHKTQPNQLKNILPLGMNNTPQKIPLISKHQSEKKMKQEKAPKVKSYKSLVAPNDNHIDELMRRPQLANILFMEESHSSGGTFDFSLLNSQLHITIIKGLCLNNVIYYDQIEPELKKEGKLYTDENFSPEITSLTSQVTEFPIAEQIVWKRLPELLKGQDLKICSKLISPNDIQQGQLGNCYFLSALSVLAEQKDFVKRLFHSKTISPTGCYSVWLCDSGEWKNVIVDDFIPCIEQEKGLQACFSRSKSNDLWVFLLEKAYAKLFGNYNNIEGGTLAEALSVLTGAPTKQFKEKKHNISREDQLWEFLTSSLKKNYPVTAASRTNKSMLKNQKDLNIISNHAYAILDVVEVYDDFGSEGSIHAVSLANSLETDGRNSQAVQRYIKMRNPWGVTGFIKEFWESKSHISSIVTDDLDKTTKKEEEDGIFWVNLLDFENYFKSTCVCELHPDYYFSFIRMGEGRCQNQFVVRFEMKMEALVYLSVQQKLKKHFRKNWSYQYSFGRVILVQTDEKGKIIGFVDGKYQGNQSITIEKRLAQGHYLALIEIDWIQKFHNEIIVTAYSKVKTEFHEENVKKYNTTALYEEVMNMLLQSSKEHRYLSKKYEYQLRKYKIDKFGLVGFVYRNDEKNVVLHTRLNFQKLSNVQIVTPSFSMVDNEAIVDLKVPPRSQVLLLLKAAIKEPFTNEKEKLMETQKANENREGYEYEYEEVYKFSNEYTEKELKAICKEKGEQKTYLKGAIVLYTYRFKGGKAEYYINTGEKNTFLHQITFEKETNILVNGREPNDMTVMVPPKEDYLLDLRVKDVWKKSNFSHTSKASIM